MSSSTSTSNKRTNEEMQQIDLQYVIGQQILPFIERPTQVIELKFLIFEARTIEDDDSDDDEKLDPVLVVESELQTKYVVVNDKVDQNRLYSLWLSEGNSTGSISKQALEKLKRHHANHATFDELCETNNSTELKLYYMISMNNI
jgi:hypothetical protein